VVGSGEGAPDAASLRAHVGAHLPDYMVPSGYVVAGRLPLTPNGSSTAARRPCRRRRGLLRCAADAAGGDPVRAVCGGAGAAVGISSLSQPFAAGDAADQPHPGSLDVELAIRCRFEAPTVAALAGRLGGRWGVLRRSARGYRRSAVLCAAAAVVPAPAGGRECRGERRRERRSQQRDLQHPCGGAAHWGAGCARAGGGAVGCGGAPREPAHGVSRARWGGAPGGSGGVRGACAACGVAGERGRACGGAGGRGGGGV
jgi:hypothetical protein